jgi:ornithine racemase
VSRLCVNPEALAQNLAAIDAMMRQHGAKWTLVVKVLCGEPRMLQLLHRLGVRAWADSRLENLEALNRELPDQESWYLRLPHLSAARSIVRNSGVSLNSELPILRALSEAAVAEGVIHRVILMVEMGDLREGVLPSSLATTYERARELPGIEVLGLGTNLGCLSGAIPSIDQFNQLIIYREWLELKYGAKLPLLSAGSSAVLPLLRKGQVPAAINHFRIGESVFLGTDLIDGGRLSDLRDDVFTLEAEVVEIMVKSLSTSVETGDLHPFPEIETRTAPGARGLRALIALGQLDTDVGGLTPLHQGWSLAGASSDVSVLNLEQRDGLRIGHQVCFRPNYTALLQLMHSRYVDVAVEGDEPTAAPPVAMYRLPARSGSAVSHAHPHVREAAMPEGGNAQPGGGGAPRPGLAVDRPMAELSANDPSA